MGVELKKDKPAQVRRIKLEPYIGPRSRHTCPKCGHKGVFSRFIDITTGQYLDDEFGRCNRESSCGYFHSPNNEDLKGSMYVSLKDVKKEYQIDESVISLIDGGEVLESISWSYLDNHLFQYLIGQFDPMVVMTEFKRYMVGTSDFWNGSTVFWQVDKDFDVRAGKIMLYNKDTGKRVKEPFNHINWIHSLSGKDFNLKQCLFGEHLISDEVTEYQIVESEKTALICSIFDNSRIWLATGGLQNISASRFKVLEGKKLVFHPDKDGGQVWEDKVKEKLKSFDCKVSRGLEQQKELPEGADLADYILHKKKA